MTGEVVLYLELNAYYLKLTCKISINKCFILAYTTIKYVESNLTPKTIISKFYAKNLITNQFPKTIRVA